MIEELENGYIFHVMENKKERKASMVLPAALDQN